MDASAHVKEFDVQTEAIRIAMDLLLDQAESILPLVVDVKMAISQSDVVVVKLRRADDEIGQGPLNSVGAVQQAHKGLAKALEDFNQHVMHLSDIRRQLNHLHPQVVNAIQPTPKLL